MLKFFFIIALIATAICAVIMLRYRSRYKSMVARATSKRAKRRLELSPEFEGVCSKGTASLRATTGFAALSAILLAVMLVSGAGFIGGNKASTDSTPKAAVEEVDAAGTDDTAAEDTDKISDDVVFYNDKVQGRSDGESFDFGPDAYADNKRGEEAREELLERCEKDPVLLAAVDSWIDVNLGTNLCGTFYEDNAEWRQAINDYASAMAHDAELFHDSYEATYGLIMEESTPSVEKIKDGSVEDQMYMLPKQYTSDNKIPTLVIRQTDQEKGHYLCLKFKIKGNTFKLNFRMECGFQPTNCAEKLNTTAEVKPSSGGSSSTPSSKPSPGTGGNKPSKPSPSPSPTKPTKPTPKPKPSGDGCKDDQGWEPSGGQDVEKRTDTPTGGGNSKPNTADPPSGGATRIDQGPGGGSKTPDKPVSPPAVDSGNGKVDGGDD